MSQATTLAMKKASKLREQIKDMNEEKIKDFDI